MIPTDPEIPDDPTLIDRLVDGELDDPARRSLLLSLDAQPDGWRRLALAFLEAQAWRGALASELPDRAAEPPRRPAPWPVARNVLTRAAGVLIVFALGWNVGRSHGLPRSVPVVAARPGSVTPVGVEAGGPMRTAVVPVPTPHPGPPPQRGTADEGPGEALAEGPRSRPEVPVPPAAEAWPARPAVVAAPADDAAAAFLLSQAGRDQLRRHGYQVEHQPAVAAVRLKDGRRVVIPLQDVKLRYVGSRTY